MLKHDAVRMYHASVLKLTHQGAEPGRGKVCCLQLPCCDVGGLCRRLHPLTDAEARLYVDVPRLCTQTDLPGGSTGPGAKSAVYSYLVVM